MLSITSSKWSSSMSTNSAVTRATSTSSAIMVIGNRAVVTLMKSGRYNLDSTLLIPSYFWLLIMSLCPELIRNLKGASKPMYNLYRAMSGRQPAQEEIDLASGKTVFDPEKHSEFIRTLQSDQARIQQAFEKQAAAATVRL